MAAAVGVSAQAIQDGRQDKSLDARPQARQQLANYTDTKGATLKVEMPAAEAAAFAPNTAYSYPAEDFKPGVVQVGPRTTYLKEGLTTDEVVRLLGKPAATSERMDHETVVTVYEFKRGEGRFLVAEFVKNALVRSTMETRGQTAESDR